MCLRLQCCPFAEYNNRSRSKCDLTILLQFFIRSFSIHTSLRVSRIFSSRFMDETVWTSLNSLRYFIFGFCFSLSDYIIIIARRFVCRVWAVCRCNLFERYRLQACAECVNGRLLRVSHVSNVLLSIPPKIVTRSTHHTLIFWARTT